MISLDFLKSAIQPSLPQNDTPDEQDARRAALGKTQENYLLSNVNSLGLPLLKTPLPKEEAFSSKYIVDRGIATAPMLANSELVKSQLTDPFGPFPGLADYGNIYPLIKEPEVAATWMTDESFGEQRLSGVNPVMIKRVIDNQSFPAKLDLKQLTCVLDSSIDIDKLIANKQLYVVDLTPYLEGIPEGSVTAPDKTIPKYLPKTIGLFYWHKDGASLKDPALKEGRLLPLAIQVDLDDNQVKIFTPNSPDLLWSIAKICFSIADVNVHEMSTHLGRAHFSQESFGAITPAQLAPQHPLFVLLKPHLRFLVFNNQAGVDHLVQTGGPVDLLLAATLDGSLAISKKAAQSWSVTETFPESIQMRHVEAKESLPHYPYRDDGILIWDAVVNYVDEYVGIYYQNEQDVQGDYELQAWAKTLADTGAEGGHIKDMPDKITSVTQLSQLLSVIIFQNSAGHSSINYPQYPYIGFNPNMPLAGYSNYRKFLAKDNPTKAEQLSFMQNFLPPQSLAVGQVEITYALSDYHFDSLGDYAKELTDPLAKHALANFTQALTVITQQIEIRNRQRAVPYTYLIPANVLNSASI